MFKLVVLSVILPVLLPIFTQTLFCALFKGKRRFIPVLVAIMVWLPSILGTYHIIPIPETNYIIEKKGFFNLVRSDVDYMAVVSTLWIINCYFGWRLYTVAKQWKNY